MLGSNYIIQMNVSAADLRFEPNATKAAAAAHGFTRAVIFSHLVEWLRPGQLHTVAVSSSSTIPAQSSVTWHSGVVAQAQSTSRLNPAVVLRLLQLPGNSASL
jgi:hypothetical protein